MASRGARKAGIEECEEEEEEKGDEEEREQDKEDEACMEGGTVDEGE